MTSCLTISVQGQQHVDMALDDGRQSSGEALRFPPVQRRMIELFRGWLSEGWEDPARRKITRRRELEVLGMLLWDQLLPGPLAAFLEEAVTVKAPDRDNRLRVELVFRDGAEALAALPWEYLYRPDTEVDEGYFLAVRPALALSRSMPLRKPVRSLAPADPPLRVLATASKPADEGPVREAPTLNAIARLADSVDVEVDVLETPTAGRFLDRVEHFRPHVVHVIAHGGYDPERGEGLIALLDDAGNAAWIPDHQFAAFFQHAGHTPHLVLLHACEGGAVDLGASFAGLAPKLMRGGVQAVVAMQYPVTNAAANAFSVAFYEELAAERPIDAAVQAGRFKMTLTRPESVDTGEFGIPVLYLRGTDAIVARAR